MSPENQRVNPMLGAVAGDVLGSVFEFQNLKRVDFQPLIQSGIRFTDDSVITVATADLLLYGGTYTDVFQHYGRRYPDAGYGGTFVKWIMTPQPRPYNSWGNGAGMRVSPVGWARDSMEEVLEEARRSAEVTHDHPEGIKGAQAVALAVFLARQGESKDTIRSEIECHCAYDLDRTLDEIRPGYSFDVSCQGSVPEAILAFMESTDFESAIRLAISIGGDSDTIACMAGAIAHAFYREIPEEIITAVRATLDRGLRIVMDEFCERFVS